ncbi:serine hydrolase domain-containing protein [Sorangium sp. So ce513]|uniref:serine hydrolase domain-containing protein n=1 Tax=Sorangium sp. So ce513 TaxID=3133315 RepID=UPI003F63078A
MGALISVAAPGCALAGTEDEGQAGQDAGAGALAPAREVMEAEVAAGQMPGAVWLVARGDDVYVDAVGVTEVGGSTPMRRDTIFRIASMTKAVTATAVMMLVEEGKLDLDAPVDRWLPELANRRVLARIDGPIDETVPAERPITVRDLMTFTMGFGVLFDASLPIQRAIDELELVNGQPVPMTPHGPDEWIRRLGTLPLMHQPGAQWMYNTGSLVQGVLVGRVADQGFDAFVRERILAPLGMRDTDFHVPADKLARFAGCGYYTDEQTGEKTRMDRDGAESAYASPPAFPSGAAGLVSTVDDYFVFARMLMNGGVHEGRRILSAASVREMTTDHLTPAQKAASSFFPGFFETHGWGHGLAVVTAPDAVSEVPGRHGWDGGFGTSCINDPGRGLIGIVMTQSSGFLFSGSLERFWRSVYLATGSA